MLEEEYLKKQRKRMARRLQKETGMKYTAALREVEKFEDKNYVPITLDELNNHNFLKGNLH